MNYLFFVISGLLFVLAITVLWNKESWDVVHEDRIVTCLTFIASGVFAIAGVLA